MINFRGVMDKNQLIIRKFDETLATKSSKHSLEECYLFIDKTYAKHTQYSTHDQKIKKQVALYKEQVDEQKKMVEHMKDSTKVTILNEVSRATHHLK